MSSARDDLNVGAAAGPARHAANSLSGDLSDGVLELLPTAVYVCDTDGLIVRYNRRAAELWGQAPQIGDPDQKFCGSLRLFLPDGRPLPHGETPMARVLETGQPVRDQQVVIERPDGSRIVLLVSIDPLRDHAGRQFGAVNCFSDITERRDLEKRLALAKDAGGIGTFDRNLATDDVRVSDTYWRLFGVEQQGFSSTYQGWLSRVHPEDRARVVADFARSFESAKYETEYRVVWPNGEIRWLHTRGISERGLDGQPHRIIGAVADVTERKRTEEELRRRAAELRLVTDSVPALIGYVDADRRYRFVNRSYETWFGRRRHEMEGRRMVEVLGEAVYDIVRPYADAALTGEAAHFEAHVPHRDGTERHVECDYLPRFESDGQVVGFYVFIHDVTERKRAEEALRAHASELATMMETVPAAVWLTHDRDVSHIMGSRYAARLFRVPLGKNLSRSPREGPAPRHWSFYKGGIEIPLSESPLRRAARGGIVNGEEVELVFDDGTRVPLLINAAPILDAMGSPIGAVAAGMDITDRKRAEERQSLIMAELDHRVRNTLGTIRSMLRLTASAAESKMALSEAICGRIDAMARAHSLLTLTGWRGASLRSLVADELAPYGTAERPRVKLDGPEVLLGPSAAVSMSLVIHELATNAVKYGALSASDGMVTVSWRIEGAADEGRLLLEWIERGGPPVKVPARQGFGSAILRGALEHEFGAGVKVEFATDGLRFAASVPLTRLAAPCGAEGGTHDAPATAAGPFSSEADAAGARILVVEDEMLIALDIQDRLEAIGAEIVGPAGRLDDAFVLADAHPDAALLDVNIGGGHVFPVADLLAERGVPFAFLTGYDARSTLPERFRDTPALQKPFSEHAITEMVRTLVGRARAAGHAPRTAAS